MHIIRRHGFTLIELLVTIAIIALLLGILVPVLGNAKALARGALCGARIHALQVGISQYGADHGHRAGGGIPRHWASDAHWGVWWNQPPTGKLGEPGYDPGHTWGQANIEAGDIWSYVQQTAAYLCPEFERLCREPPRGSECAPGTAYGAQYYGPGGCIVPEFSPSQFAPVRSYAMSARFIEGWQAFADPEAICLLEVHPWRNLNRNPSYGIAPAHASPEETPGQYHNGEAHCAFVAGHVKRLPPVEILANLTPPEEEAGTQ